MRRIKSLPVLLAGLVLFFLVGCSNLTPPSTAVAAWRNTHDQAAHIYTKFEAQNPGGEADAAKALYQSEESLIQKLENKPLPLATPVAAPVTTPAGPSSYVPPDAPPVRVLYIPRLIRDTPVYYV